MSPVDQIGAGHDQDWDFAMAFSTTCAPPSLLGHYSLSLSLSDYLISLLNFKK